MCSKKKKKVAFLQLQEGSKRIYLLSIQRALKFYDFSSSVEYDQLESALDNTTCDNEFDKPQKEPVTIKTKNQFEALHALTWELANDTTLPFSEHF